MQIAPKVLGLLLGLATAFAHADISIGVTLSATGPAASLGIPEKNAIALMPDKIAGQTVTYTVLDDATDPSAAAKNARKLVSEAKVDVLIGSSTVPTSLALVDIANESKTAVITLAPIQPTPDKLPWVFVAPQSNAIMAAALVNHMARNGVKKVAYIGFSDPFGEGWWTELQRLAPAKNIQIVANERFNRQDTSVGGQVLKIISANPDAVLIGGSGTPSVLPQATLAERGFKGRVYQTHGSANRDFLRVGGKKVEGALMPVGPIMVAEQLPDTHPSKAVALEFNKKYEAAHGPDSRSGFSGYAWDAGLLVRNALAQALKKAQPGTLEFRQATRDALESTRNLALSHGVSSMSKTDHTGFDDNAVVVIQVDNGEWKLIK